MPLENYHQINPLQIDAQNIIDSGEDSGVVGTNVFVEVEEERHNTPQLSLFQ